MITVKELNENINTRMENEHILQILAEHNPSTKIKHVDGQKSEIAISDTTAHDAANKILKDAGYNNTHKIVEASTFKDVLKDIKKRPDETTGEYIKAFVPEYPTKKDLKSAASFLKNTIKTGIDKAKRGALFVDPDKK